MLRLLQLFFALSGIVLFAVGLLTVAKSPDWSYWKLALLAGEFGHWLGLCALVVAAGAWMTRGSHLVFGGGAFAVSLLAAGLFLKPLFQARQIAPGLPAQLERDLGPVALNRSPFAVARLMDDRPAVVQPETHRYADGLSFDFYRAAARPAAPCVLLVHGGGWDSGARDEIAHFNHWLAGRGYAVAAIDYRLAPKFPWPAQRDDVAAAIAFLKSNAATLGIDATRLVLLGRSAGGQLAEAAAYATPDPAIRGVIALYAPADVHFAWEFGRDDDVLNSPQLLKNFLGGTPETAREAYDSASPIRYAGKSAPPTLLIHGALDTLVWHRQSERLAQKLREAGVTHTFVSLPWATHAFEYNLNGPGGQLSTYAIEWFLAAVTK
ncbi:MAG TPA: alpha/beta hydrolase [Opitutaceae bacterium]|nr:alpha/beta hydrolase [Opitutaceae bacterium]